MLRKLRSGLTILGIIFGVCSVITMLAVGNGAAHEAQLRIKELGSNNIIIDTIKPSQDEEESGGNYQYGITRTDLSNLQLAIPQISNVIPQRFMNEDVIFRDNSKPAQIIGTVPTYSQITTAKISKGRFLCELDIAENNNTCVINQNLASQLFPYQDPLANQIKIKNAYFQIVGIIAENPDSEKTSNYNIYIPLSTMQNRYSDVSVESTTGSYTVEKVELHKLVIQMQDPDSVLTAEPQILNILDRLHSSKDYKITVPLQLLNQAKQSQRTFSILLGSIAAISLLVGGIGIMNIGIRLALPHWRPHRSHPRGHGSLHYF